MDWAGYHSGLAEQCSYVEKPSTAAKNHLLEHIIAQDLAVESIIAAIEAWEFTRPTAKDRIPLVLAFTGPTGTGKTETSYVLARSIFKHTRKLYKSDKKVASGLLMIRGEDFSDNFTNPVTAYHRLIKSMIVDHLIHCSGKAIVVFDEVQKVIPHTLDVLMEAMSSSAKLSYTVGGVTSTLDTSNVIFILISDIGVSQMMDVIRKYPSRNEVSALKLEQTVKAALDAQWNRLEFGKIVNKVIPFLPLQQPDIQSIIASKLDIMDRTYRGKRWHRLWIDPSLAQRLSLLDSIHYEQRKLTVNGETAAIQLYAKYDDEQEVLEPEILLMSNEELRQRIRLMDNDIRIMRSDMQRIDHESNSQRERIKENNEKVKMNKQLPYLVGNVVEILELSDDEGDENMLDSSHAGDGTLGDKKVTSAVMKTSTRQTVFLPIPGLVSSEELVPNDLVGTNKDSYLILEKLPVEYDSRVKAMEVDEKPTEEYSDIGGLDKQIQELVEAVVLPMTHKEKFDALGITPPKGVLLHGPPGTGKTLLARACAKQTDAIFLKIAAPQLVQMFIGDGAKLDAIGTKRFGGDQSGDREVQRTMLELLSQLDGFTSNTKIKVIAATNRPDVLDPALLRSGRLDRKIELPHPTEEARGRILQIHSRKMNVDLDDTNFDELARCTDDFNGAQLKAVCVEAGMLALRHDSNVIKHEDFMEGISVVSAKKKTNLQYFA
ncbi:unnamed protein product [Albugo candida]|uniref:AAA+ ATPase domain-containing protein n=1 Tax=Albugo candida TaxID=65357 RepID=A0A024FZH3_9STRA|nr:unnamed protein product [Albugo candida]|eukprot:CCI39989.1 unnamed protein product [Albugo candida]